MGKRQDARKAGKKAGCLKIPGLKGYGECARGLEKQGLESGLAKLGIKNK